MAEGGDQGDEIGAVRRLLAEEQWHAALKALGPLRRAREQDPVVWELQARALQGAGELTEAQFAADRWAVLRPGTAEPLVLRADLLEQRGKHYPATEVAEELVTLDPSDVNAYRRLARSARAAGLVPRARVAVNRALELDPLSAETYELAGMIELAAAQPGAAVDQFRQSLRLDPDNGRVAQQLQRALEAQAAKADGARQATKRTKTEARTRTRSVRAAERDQAKAERRADRALGSSGGRRSSRRDRVVGALILLLIVGLALVLRLR